MIQTDAATSALPRPPWRELSVRQIPEPQVLQTGLPDLGGETVR